MKTVIWFIIKASIVAYLFRIAILTVNVPLAMFVLALTLWLGWRQHSIVQRKMLLAHANKQIDDIDKKEDQFDQFLKDLKEKIEKDKK